jgi:amidophosphoribosyltransferase
MCGITGLISISNKKVIYDLYESLYHLQHRGQDSYGFVTVNNNIINCSKNKGLISENNIDDLDGNIGIGHVRYRTFGKIGITETQPLIKNGKHKVILVHNGHISLSEQLIKFCKYNKINYDTNSDSELLLNILSNEINKYDILTDDIIQKIIYHLIIIIEGSFSVIAIIVGYGMVVFKDKHSIRPLIYGKKGNDYLISSESVSLDCLGYDTINDIYGGDILIFRNNQVIKHDISKSINFEMKPCIFEWIYLARADSTIYGVSVYQARMKMGEILAKKIKKEIIINQFDYVVPIPDASRPCAQSISTALNIPYIEAIIKNRYVNRTFIMSNQKLRQKNIKKKLNVISQFVKGKNLIIVDDSIVRGNTMKHITQLLLKKGANKIVVVSCSPEIKFKNKYGIDIPNNNDLISYHKTPEEIARYYQIDKVIFQDLKDLTKSIQFFNNTIKNFELSIFG